MGLHIVPSASLLRTRDNAVMALKNVKDMLASTLEVYQGDDGEREEDDVGGDANDVVNRENLRERDTSMKDFEGRNRRVRRRLTTYVSQVENYLPDEIPLVRTACVLSIWLYV